MPRIIINFHVRDTIPDRLENLARELDITPEQLVIRVICERLAAEETDRGPAEPGHDLEDFLVKNGVLKNGKSIFCCASQQI